jgi:hypothetical protein
VDDTGERLIEHPTSELSDAEREVCVLVVGGSVEGIESVEPPKNVGRDHDARARTVISISHHVV